MRFRVLALAVFTLTVSGHALASFHLTKVKEVFPGTVASPNAQFIMLQAFSAGQNFVGGHSVIVYDAAGVVAGTFTFSGNVANGANQMTTLIATTEAAALFGVTADLTMTPAISPVGGKVCWDTSHIDCVAWGSYTGSSTGVGTPFNAPVGLAPGQSIRRRLDICGYPTILESCDDTNDSANDFRAVPPAPINNAGTAGTIPPSTCGNNVLEGLEQCDDGNLTGGDGCSAVCTFEPDSVAALALFVDEVPTPLLASNGVLEPGETVPVRPTWKNNGLSAITLTGSSALFTGPAGATYGIVDGSAAYGTLAAGASANCYGGVNNCYTLSVSAPATRPAAHWDATFTEVLSNTAFKAWAIHVGESFPDVPTSYPFYRFIENLFHNGITGGCAGGNYCPGSPVTRAQMAVFLLKSKHGSSYIPPTCTGVFGDVICPSAFADWIERLAAEGITGGCGGGNYCPNNPVTRQQMAVFLLKALDGAAYTPPACVGIFSDVTCTPGVGFPDWIEELYHRGITGGCAVGPPPLYCPTNPNNRGQMAVFLVKTFNLALYGP
jgi:cysteine-rich repeat protein